MATSKTPNFLAGQLVEVRSAAEIAATLDAEGQLDGMPFMPEMVRFCGQKLYISRRADKTCVEGFHGMRKLGGSVLLDEVRCDGAAHDGCQRNCQIFWNEAWLKPVTDGGASLIGDLRTETLARERLETARTRKDDSYYCQSTVLGDITAPQSKWAINHLVTDVARGELTTIGLILTIGRTIVNRIRGLFGLGDLGALVGSSETKSKDALDLKPGEWVRIKPADEIKATLGPDGRNFGLSFEPEMSRYIGGLYQVDFPVRTIILEETGRMAKLNRTVALKGLSCKGICAKNCPRANTLYWRESWLERVENVDAGDTRQSA